MTEAPVDGRPTADLVRRATDRQVVEQLLEHDALTRAELAARTGISKPTVSESVRRLLAAGVLEEAGAQAGKRGPAGTLCRLRADLGVSLAVVAGPGGVVVETYDVRGTRLARGEEPVPAPVSAAVLGPVLVRAVTTAAAQAPGPVRVCTVSLAGPVDRHTSRLVRLPNAPFLLDELAPAELLADLVDGPVLVDNDVNWMAVAEHHLGAAHDLEHVVLCYLGDGIGSAAVVDGTVLRGHRGLAGELAYVATVGPDGRSRPLVECLGAWGLTRPGSDAIDGERVLALVTGTEPADEPLRAALAEAVATALASAVALLDPEAVLLGGLWGTPEPMRARVAQALAARAMVATPVRRTALGDGAALTGAGLQAVRTARAALLAAL